MKDEKDLDTEEKKEDAEDAAALSAGTLTAAEHKLRHGSFVATLAASVSFPLPRAHTRVLSLPRLSFGLILC